MGNMSWEKEFWGLQFSDKRLQKRFFKIMDFFLHEPGESILSACGSRSKAKAVYRLLANERIFGSWKFGNTNESKSERTPSNENGKNGLSL